MGQWYPSLKEAEKMTSKCKKCVNEALGLTWYEQNYELVDYLLTFGIPILGLLLIFIFYIISEYWG